MNVKATGKVDRLRLFWMIFLITGFILGLCGTSIAQGAEQLQKKIESLETELSKARAELEDMKKTQESVEKAKPSEKIQLGPLKIGGAIRTNYVIGDYKEGPGPSRGGHGGNFELDTFRINMDFNYQQVAGKAEYRFYNGYNFLHTGWLGYNFKDGSQLQVGVNRVPFGPGAYGVSQSWFFDQHYYVGLSDDMDLGAKFSTPIGSLKLDIAYYYGDEGNWRGSTPHSASYSYDVVDVIGTGYEEEHQVNLRAIYSFSDWAVATDIGTSLQYGMMKSNGPQKDGDHYAGSVHMVNNWNNFKLASQLTYYKYDIGSYTNQSGTNTDKLIDMGAYDYAYPIAAEAWIPSVSLSYQINTPKIGWLDYILPYAEYSTIVKEESSFNDSELMTLGIAWASGGWYIYTEWARSNGNYFVGDDSFTEFGANPNDDWQDRFNINIGYYF